MVKLYEGGAYLLNGTTVVSETEYNERCAAAGQSVDKEAARKGSIAYRILEAHNTSDNISQAQVSRLEKSAIKQLNKLIS